MDRYDAKILDIATQICVAKASSSTTTICKASGEQMGEFFEALYNKLAEIIKSED